MGQRVGKVSYTRAAAPFVNLTPTELEQLWRSFNEVAEGFGLRPGELRRIFAAARSAVRHEDVDALFRCLDTDLNGLIDALETLAGLCLASSLDDSEKVDYIVRLYDLDESGSLTVDEVTLALRGALVGVAKLADEDPPLDSALDAMARLAFARADRDTTSRLSSGELQQFCASSPEVRSWVAYHSASATAAAPALPTGAEAGGGPSQPEDDPFLSEELAAQDAEAAGRSAAEEEAANPEDASSRERREGRLHAGHEAGGRAPATSEPWYEQARHLVPSDPPMPPLSAPDAAASLSHFHGLGTAHARQIVAYGVGGRAVFASDRLAASMGTAPGRREQLVCWEHTGRVVSLAVHPSGRVAATGERGRDPRVVVWRTDRSEPGSGRTAAVLRVLRGWHAAAVTLCAFSPSGRLLATVGADAARRVVVFDWAAGGVREHAAAGLDLPERSGAPGSVAMDAPSGTREVLACCWRDEATLVTAGRDHVSLWDVASGRQVAGLFGSAPGVRVQTVLCLAAFGGSGPRGAGPGALVAAGTLSGHVYVWRGRSCVRAVRAHEGPVLSLAGRTVGLASASSDGRVRVWSARLECETTSDVSGLGPFDAAVAAVDWDPSRDRLLVGTRGCELFELAASDGRNAHEDSGGGPLVQGHCRHEVWGLAAHPTRAEYCTVGDDGTLRVWEAGSRPRLVRLARLGCPSRAVTYSPEGDFVAIGLGADAPLARSAVRARLPDKAGGFVVVRSSDLSLVHSARDARGPVTALRFAPDGRTLALASEDSNVYLYEGADFSLRCVCAKHTSPVRTVDFSESGDMVQSSSSSREHLFFHCDDGRQQHAVAAMKDVRWDTWTSPVGWHAQGLWPAAHDGAERLAVARSRGGGVVAVGDDLGRLWLGRFPVLSPEAQRVQLSGHEAPVTAVAWLAGDRGLVSVGGSGRCVVEWRVGGASAGQGPSSSSAADDHDAEAGGAHSRGRAGSEGESSTPRRGAPDDDDDDDEVGEEEEEALALEPDSDDEADMTHGSALLRDLATEAACEADRDERASLLRVRASRLPGPPDDDRSGKPPQVEPPDGAPAEPAEPPRRWRSLTVEPSSRPAPGSGLPVPDVDAVAEWVHGFSGRSTRGAARFVAGGALAFPAASFGVILSPTQQRQRVLSGHSAAVTALAVHPSGRFVATAQGGRRPRVLVWRVEAGDVASSIDAGFERGVSHVAFGGEGGALLAASAEDDDHTMTLLDWRSRAVVARAAGAKTACLGLAVSRDGSAVAQVGDGFVRFHAWDGRSVRSRRGVLGRLGRRQPFFCAAFRPAGAAWECLVGTYDGHVYVFGSDRRLVRAVRAHTGAVYCLAAPLSAAGAVVTGGRDKVVRLWTPALEPVSEVSVADLGSVDGAVTSVDWDPSRDRLLVGTRGCELFELAASDGRNAHEDSGGGPLVQGHCRHEVWGLAAHPTRAEYCTVGDDGTLRVREAGPLPREVAAVSVDGVARAVAYSPDGRFIVVGMGGDTGRGRTRDDGRWVVVSTDDWEVAHRAHDGRAPVTHVGFSPDGSCLGVAARDGRLLLYDVTGGFALRGVFDRHRKALTRFDFSADGRRVRTACEGLELMYADAATGAHLPSAAAMRDVEWATQSVPLGWPMRGAWPPEGSGAELTAVARSGSGRHVVVCDSVGSASILRFPCPEDGAARRELSAHRSRVTGCAWLSGDGHIITVGGADRCVVQWRVVSDEDGARAAEAAESAPAADPAAPGGVLVAVADYFPPDSFAPPADVAAAAAAAVGAASEADDETGAGAASAGAASAVGAVGARAATLVPPSRPPAVDPRAPSERLRLEWAHGFRGADTASSVWHAPGGALVYPAAALGVVFDAARHRQRFYRGHDADLTCLVVDRAHGLAASGQGGARPRLHVWSADGATPRCALPRVHAGAVRCAAFSGDGRRVVSVGAPGRGSQAGCAWSVAVSSSPLGDWTDGRTEAVSDGDARATLFACCLPRRPEEDSDVQLRFATGGDGHVRFWRLRSGALTSEHGLFGAKGRSQAVACGAVVAGALVTGTASGQLFAWDGRVVARAVDAYDPGATSRAVVALCAHESGVLAACADGRVRLFSTGLDPLATYDASASGLQSVSLSPDGESAVVGTRSGCVVEVALATGSAVTRAEGHSGAAMAAPAPHPASDALVATTASDGAVRVWDCEGRRCLAEGSVGGHGLCVAWSPDGSVLAVGVGSDGGGGAGPSGGIVLLRADTLEPVHEAADASAEVLVVAFSPNGALLAAGCANGEILVYDARGGRFGLTYTMHRHVAAVRRLDFRDDSTLLRAESDAAELLFLDLRTGRHVASAASVRDATFATATVRTGWSASGLWPRHAAGSEVTSVGRSGSRALLAAGDAYGQIRLVRFPAALPADDTQATFVSAHASPVAGVAFSATDRFLLSAGRSDRTLLQWRVARSAADAGAPDS